MPERGHPSFAPQIAPEFEVPLIDIFNELRMVKLECRQLRIRVDNVDPQQTGAWGVVAEITSRQNAMATRIGRIEVHINTTAQDQSNALESNQALWRSIQELQGQATGMDSDRCGGNTPPVSASGGTIPMTRQAEEMYSKALNLSQTSE